jgi:hypothetical protein
MRSAVPALLSAENSEGPVSYCRIIGFGWPSAPLAQKTWTCAGRLQAVGVDTESSARSPLNSSARRLSPLFFVLEPARRDTVQGKGRPSPVNYSVTFTQLLLLRGETGLGSRSVWCGSLRRGNAAAGAHALAAIARVDVLWNSCGRF